jgi:hypothetical protein
MTDGIHFEVDTEAGRLRLLCNAYQFNRLATWIRQEADVQNLVTVPATDIRVISVELVTEEETPPGMGKQLVSYGCAIAFMMVMIGFAIGVWTVVHWLMK